MSGSLARRYARAIYDIGVENGDYERIGTEVAELASALHGSKDLHTTLTGPSFPRTERENVLKAVLERSKASKEVSNFMRLLLDRERVAFLPDIARELKIMIDNKSGRVRATITSAVPLSDSDRNKIISSLEKRIGKKIDADSQLDPALLGGVIAQVGDTVYDGSLRTQLKNMQSNLIR